LNPDASESEALLTPREVAAMFGVTPTTVTRWARTGKLKAVRTPGGHRRYREPEVRALLSDSVPELPQPGSDD
jgi:excisionase family DNA binding protein